jgi:macrolide-specific efflux system membrane fusion protein
MRRWIVWLIVLVFLGAGGVALQRWMKQSDTAPSFRAVQATRGDLEETVLATGIVQPQNRLEIKPPIAGRAEEILVREGQSVRKGQVLAWMSSGERAALLDAASARGPEELAHWKGLFNPAPLIAPLDGLIIARNVEPGQTVTAADAVLVMSDRLIVKAQVDETDIGQVKLGQLARIVVDAYPQQTIEGRVDHISYEAKTVNNVTIYEVDILPRRPPEFMRSGMTANVTFIIAARPGVLLLPAEAIHTDNGAATVQLPAASETEPPRSAPITVGLTDGKRVEVLSGLEEGATVLVPVARMPASAQNGLSSPLTPGGASRRPQNRTR